MFSMEYESLCNSYCFNSSAVWIWWFKKLFTWKSHFIFPVEASKYLVGLVAKRACPSAMKMWPLKWQKCYSFMIAYRQHSIKKMYFQNSKFWNYTAQRKKSIPNVSCLCCMCLLLACTNGIFTQKICNHISMILTLNPITFEINNSVFLVSLPFFVYSTVLQAVTVCVCVCMCARLTQPNRRRMKNFNNFRPNAV